MDFVRKTKKIFLVSILFALLIPKSVMASQWKLINTSEGNTVSKLLFDDGNARSEGTLNHSMRGEIFSIGTVEIADMQNGKIYLMIRTLAHRDVDKIYHNLYLEQWDEKRERWVQEDYWKFKKTTDDNDGDMHTMTHEIIVSGLEVNKYYRARGSHQVELNGVTEGGNTETGGVLLTKN